MCFLQYKKNPIFLARNICKFANIIISEIQNLECNIVLFFYKIGRIVKIRKIKIKKILP